MNKGLYTYVGEVGIIVSPEPILSPMRKRLLDSYEVLLFQMLCEKAIICVSSSTQYPVLYPGTMLVPESDWGTIELENHAVLMNEDFILAYLGKNGVEVTSVDLLTVFEMLIDTEKLLSFGDEHGLTIGASDARF